ncbi:MAG: di-heme oxidoredictase family protein [Pirellulales bacterium]
MSNSSWSFGRREKFVVAALVAAGLPLVALAAQPPKKSAAKSTAERGANSSRPASTRSTGNRPPERNRPERTPPRPPVSPPTFGDPLPGLTPAQLAAFNEGKVVFAAEEDAADGLGPVFTENSCGACHIAPALGGASGRRVTRIGATINGEFNPLAELGGSLLQDRGIGDGVGVNGPYSFVGEVIPPQAELVAQRRTTALFGLGLVEAVTDQTLLDLARFQSVNSPGTAGLPHIVANLATGQPAVGRFGWKAQHATLFDFSGDAYVNEMGITTPLFPFENAPQGNVAALAANPLPLGVPNEPDNDDLERFATFMRFLAPPPRGEIPGGTVLMNAGFQAADGRNRRQAQGEVLSGRQIFHRIGCAACHVPALKTGDHSVAALRNKVFFVWSDFLLHDMGQLGDGMVQGQATGRLMRTAPLWGLRAQPSLLHDGRADSAEEAILEHDGQAAPSRDAFIALPASAKTVLLDFLNSL